MYAEQCRKALRGQTMGQLKFVWIFENGQFVGRRVVIEEGAIREESLELLENEEIYPKAS